MLGQQIGLPQRIQIRRNDKVLEKLVFSFKPTVTT